MHTYQHTYRGHEIKRSAYEDSRRWYVQRHHADGTPYDESTCPQANTLDDARRIIDGLSLNASWPVKRTKDTGRRRTINGTDWPIVHQLTGNTARGFEVTEDLCNGDFAKRRSFTTCDEAAKYRAYPLDTQ